jgi:adenylate cyclase
MPGIDLIKDIIYKTTPLIDMIHVFLLKEFRIIISVIVLSLIVIIVTLILILVLRKIKNKTNRKKQCLYGETRTITFLAARFCSLNSIDEVSEASEVLSLLNECLVIARESIEKTGGIIEIFVDGTFIAYWEDHAEAGSPAHDALNAVRAAMLIRMSMLNFNKERIAAGLPALPFLIGISSGTASFSVVGGGKKNEGFIFGDVCIAAAKARETAEKNSTDIIITAKTWRLIKNYVITEEVQSLDEHTDNIIRLFAVINLRFASGTKQLPPTTLPELRKNLNTVYLS